MTTDFPMFTTSLSICLRVSAACGAGVLACWVGAGLVSAAGPVVGFTASSRFHIVPPPRGPGTADPGALPAPREGVPYDDTREECLTTVSIQKTGMLGCLVREPTEYIGRSKKLSSEE
jgi:hypothetical protein